MPTLASGLSLSSGGTSIDATAVPGIPSSRRTIVAWGDSLTQGAGASSGQNYLQQAAAALPPGRVLLNHGIGGQDVVSIAARQGGMPILLSLDDDMLPARTEALRSWSHIDAFEGAQHIGGDRGGTLALVGERLAAETPSWLQGIAFPLDLTVPYGHRVEVVMEIDLPAGMALRVSGIMDDAILWAANDGNGSEGYTIAASGVHTFTLYAGGIEAGRPTTFNRLVVLTENPPSGDTVFSMGSVTARIEVERGVASVTARSVDAIGPGMTLPGSLDGVAGTIVADAGGVWQFLRSAVGTARPCGPGAMFVPEAAIRLRSGTQWFWVGNNGITLASHVGPAMAAVSAMVGHLRHDRFLLLGALPRPDRVEAIEQFNAELAQAYPGHFLDALGALQQADDGTANDAADIAAGLVPRSLRTDDVHLNDAGYAVIAGLVATATTARRW